MKKLFINFVCLFVPSQMRRDRLRRYLKRKILINSSSYEKKYLSDLFKMSLAVDKIPPASGILRDIQLCTLKILKEVDRICREENIKYWLSFGSLLGAVRSGKYIPWDDDIDISMLRDDYKKFVRVFNEKTTYKNLKAVFWLEKKCNIIKIINDEIPFLFIDIFPCDVKEGKMSLKEKFKFSSDLQNMAVKFNKKNVKSKTLTSYDYKYERYYTETIPGVNIVKNFDEATIFYGIDFLHYWNCIAFDYKDIFPLKEIEFEGSKFFAPANSEIYLTCIYGDYMKLPDVLHYHFNIKKLSLEDMLKIKQFRDL